jgi:hypothetical protein
LEARTVAARRAARNPCRAFLPAANRPRGCGGFSGDGAESFWRSGTRRHNYPACPNFATLPAARMENPWTAS